MQEGALCLIKNGTENRLCLKRREKENVPFTRSHKKNDNRLEPVQNLFKAY
jgi:hypothetical protein